MSSIHAETFLAALRAEDLSAVPAAALAADLVELRRVIDGVEAEWQRRLAAFDRAGGAGEAGAVSTAAWLRGACRLSPGVAAARVELARSLPRWPRTAAALAAGEISVGHAGQVVAAVTELAEVADAGLAADAEPALVEVARRVDPARLRRELVHVRHALVPDAAAAAAEDAHQRRRLSVSETFDGMVALDGLLDPEAGAVLLSALAPLLTPAGPDDRRTPVQRRADALVDLCRRHLDHGTLPMIGGERPHLTVVVDLPTLEARTSGVQTCTRCSANPAAATEASRPADPHRPANTRPQPADATPRPADTMSRPAGTMSRPADATPRPAGTMSRPADATPRPAGTMSRPADATPRPADTMSRPAGATPRPAGAADPGRPPSGRPPDPAHQPPDTAPQPAETVPLPPPAGDTTASRAATNLGADGPARPPGPTGPAVGRPVGLRAAETEWAGPICGEAARRLACDALITRVITDGASQPLDVGRRTRTTPPAIRTALVTRDRGCAFPGCDRPPAWTDAHHLHHWANGGPTALDNLVLLCRRHHRAVHEGGWRLARTPDNRWTARPPGHTSGTPPAA
jgi:hypothetical protein